jgi:hypothetical protein
MVKLRSIFILVAAPIVSPPGLDPKEFSFDFQWF